MKLRLQFVGPFEVEWMVNAAAVQLKLPASINVHPTFTLAWGAAIALIGQFPRMSCFRDMIGKQFGGK